jgi:hypothetical protein
VRDNFKGFDIYLMGTMKTEKKRYLDKLALKSTLSMCRDEGDLEAFIDAIPGYLQQADPDHDDHTKSEKCTRITDVGSLLVPEGKDPKKSPLRHRFEDLFASCTHNHESTDQGSRRHRAITCSSVIWEMSKASLSSTLSSTGKRVAFDLRHLPKSICDTLLRLTSDTDLGIAASAQRTMAVFKRAIMEHVFHPEPRTDDDGSKDSLTAPAKAMGDMNIPFFPPYQAGQLHGGWSDERLKTVTEFLEHILAHIKRPEQPSPLDLVETRMTLHELCRGREGWRFLRADQQHLVKVLSDVSQAHSPYGSAAVSTGTLYPWFFES